MDGNPFQFHVSATDLAGQQINFLAPMIFVSLSETDLQDNVVAEYPPSPRPAAARPGARRSPTPTRRPATRC